MASPAPGLAPSKRPREAAQGDVNIGHFKRLEQIGQGSFATVYKAVHTRRGGYVAVKSVNLSKLNKKLKDNLFSEIEILKGLQHPHIVSLFDCRESPTHIHLVMEYCPLGDLSYFIKKRESLARNPNLSDLFKKYPNPPAGGLHEAISRHFLKQLASALEFLRGKNLIHRDVKPQNLLINPSPLYYSNPRSENLPYVPNTNSLIPIVGVESMPMLKIADFGFARSLPSTSLAETLCGSPLYMAPEILRYEKYDAKADLWSVGTVAFEMMIGRPPFRASNHVELLRKIERGEDNIKFPDEPKVSSDMKALIRDLLKRNPVERIGFADFFECNVVKNEIPGLVGEDRPREILRDSLNKSSSGSIMQRSLQERKVAEESDANEKYVLAPEHVRKPPPRPEIGHSATAPAGHFPRAYTEGRINPTDSSPRPNPPVTPSTHADQQGATQGRSSRKSSEDKDNLRTAQEAREIQERAAQDVAFERDYVVIEKKAVEVNALADELAASPAVQGAGRQHAMVRRNTAQANLPSGGTQVPARAIQIASGMRPDHTRQASYERRPRGNSSTTSAISKAISLATVRLASLGISPPMGMGGRGPSPPLYAPYPPYTTTQGSMLMVGDGGKTSVALDEDAKSARAIEEAATRSDVVYGFAEVKYKQLIPLAPSVDQGLGLRGAGLLDKDETSGSTDDCGLTVDAIVTLSEEALVLYVKALSLLARSMDIAGSWWNRKNRGEVAEELTSQRPGSGRNTDVDRRVNSVVQWVRGRFNEVLEKADFVRLKLIEAQKRLPPDHPSHPSNHPSSSSTSTAGMGTSADNVIVSAGVSAEKLMYQRAVEMSRSAALNELVCEDLSGCEIAYITAIRMLEAVLELDEEMLPRKLIAAENAQSEQRADNDDFNPLNPEDRESVLKMIQGTRSRLRALQKKMRDIAGQKRIPSNPSTTPTNKNLPIAVPQVSTAGGSSPRSR